MFPTGRSIPAEQCTTASFNLSIQFCLSLYTRTLNKTMNKLRTKNLQGLSRCRPGKTCPTGLFQPNSVRQPAQRPLPDFRYLELHVKTPESCQDFEECKNLANLCSGSEEFRDSHLSSNSWVCKGVDCKIRLGHVRTLKLNWFQVSNKVTNINLRTS